MIKEKKKKNKIEKLIIKNENLIKKHEKLFNQHNDDKYDQLMKKILINTQNLWVPDKYNKLDDTFNDNNGKQYTSHSWFDIIEYVPNELNDIYDANISNPITDQLIKCEKIKMYPTKLQKKLLLNWLNSYRRMYNETIKLIKKYRFENKKITLNWKKLRTRYLKEIKNDILIKSQLTKNIPLIKKKPINTKINGHVLDFAIQDACSKLKSCISNLRNGNIKHFRMRYLKQTKDTHIMKIEKDFIHTTKNTFCSNIFKENFLLQDNFKLQNIQCDFTIHYNAKVDEFQILNPIKIEQYTNNYIQDSCGLDPGIKTFMTGHSNNKCIKIGNNLKKTIIKYHKHINRINRSWTKKDLVKKKIRKKYYKRISNVVDDLHWKTINYLTNNFNNILIGNLSTKGIIKKKLNNELDANNKIVAQFMGLYKFKQRLKYKCLSKGIGYKEIDEAYTTMTCSNCAYKNDVGMKRHIKCAFCKLSIDRDFNAARNILLKGTN